MSVNCTVTLPHTAALSDITAAVGILLGCPRTFDPDHGWVIVKGARAVPGSMPECPGIRVETPAGRRARYLFHYELKGGRGILPRATPEGIALGRALVQTFGGTFEAHDRGDVTPEHYPVPDCLDVEDGPAWYQRQALLAALCPLTSDTIDACRAEAAYS